MRFTATISLKSLLIQGRFHWRTAFRTGMALRLKHGPGSR